MGPTADLFAFPAQVNTVRAEKLHTPTASDISNIRPLGSALDVSNIRPLKVNKRSICLYRYLFSTCSY